MSMETSRERGQDYLIELRAAVVCDLEFLAHESELLSAVHGVAQRIDCRVRRTLKRGNLASSARVSQLRHFLRQPCLRSSRDALRSPPLPYEKETPVLPSLSICRKAD
jgi:hypothetical protein